ncbi:MAG: hypothetical protein WDW38_010193, partial [Sanguina aurantia]
MQTLRLLSTWAVPLSPRREVTQSASPPGHPGRGSPPSAVPAQDGSRCSSPTPTPPQTPHTPTPAPADRTAQPHTRPPPPRPPPHPPARIRGRTHQRRPHQQPTTLHRQCRHLRQRSPRRPQGTPKPPGRRSRRRPRRAPCTRHPRPPTATPLPPHGSAPAQESTSTLEEHWELTGGDPSFLPSPSNLPSSEADTLYVPRKDIWTLTDQPGIDMFTSGPAAWGRLPQVYVILFGVGERDTEGIYSLRAIGDDGLPTETIISFENEEDAQQYSGLLEATMEHTPAVCSISPRELMDFCAEQGYSCRLEPRGSLLIPPDYNVGVTDWERSLRLSSLGVHSQASARADPASPVPMPPCGQKAPVVISP